MDDFSKGAVTYQFAGFELNGATEQLFADNERVKIEPQLCNFLLLLLANRGELVSRQQIQDEVWAGRLVTDEAIRAAIKKLRELLGDDARAPRFIKTLPKQGYKWVAPVELESAAITHQPEKKGLSQWHVLVVAGIVCFVGYVFWQWQHKTQPVKNGPSQTQLEQVTDLAGSETFADLHLPTNKLVFLHRQANHSPQQLYVKSLTTEETVRLSWDQASYSNTYWSKDGKQLAFDRQLDGHKTLHIANFDQAGNVQEIRQISHPQLAGKFVIGWLHDQSGLLLAQEMKPGKQHGIFRYHFHSNMVEAVSSPNVAGRGDYLAAQSHDGSKLAILREVSAGQVSLLIVESSTGRMLANRSLPYVATRMSWQQDNEAVILTSFFGQTSRYVLNTDFFDPYPELPENTMDIFASCGKDCYILRQHNGDFLDIKEVPLFSIETEQPLTPVLQRGRLFKMPGAQDFARYTGQGDELVFVSLIDQSFVIQHLNADNRVGELGRLARSVRLTNLSVSQDARKAAGVADGRLFLLALDTTKSSNQPAFLTDALERIDNPYWHKDNRHLFMTHYTANSPSVVLYDTQTGQRKLLLPEMTSFKPLHDDMKQGVAIDTQGMAWLVGLEGASWRKQLKLTSVSADNQHRWAVRKGFLYFTRAVGRQAQLCRYPMAADKKVNEAECHSIGENQFRLSFDIHQSKDKLMLVESLSAESNIVRLTW